MIHLIAMNPSIDAHFVLPPRCRGKVGSLAGQELFPGGKALNVARFLRRMKVPAVTWIVGGAGTDPTHALYRSLLARHDAGLNVRLFRTSVPIRINLHLESSGKFEKRNHPGFPPARSEWEVVRRKVMVSTKPGDLVVLTGRLPGGTEPSLFHDWVLDLQSAGRACLVDTSGQALREALRSRPAWVKVNLFEAEEAVGKRFRDLRALREQVPLLVRRGWVRGAVTDGPNGAVAWEGGDIRARKPSRPAQRRAVVGAGDGFLAGWLAGLQAGLPFEERFRRAMDCGEEVARSGIFGFREVHRGRR